MCHFIMQNIEAYVLNRKNFEGRHICTFEIRYTYIGKTKFYKQKLDKSV